MVELIHSLSKDPSPLIELLASLPVSLLHGDLKLDNIGLGVDGHMWLIDWAMPMLAPPAVELGWFLAINSRRLPVALDEVMKRYAHAAALSSELRRRHDAAAVLCGLLLRGWRKALDADEGEPEELRWWCEHAADAQQLPH
jgi:aminoglycoside phosphotransferase (APT) family kinase protein